ncbi:hypothetical protein IWX84_003114 [Flavobacterium sp. CG_9.10]|uniref:hypothetical protein n=1 Tax=Flavobacterium sp. CG_9.10 TaxID=2787729 RepID=UPI0018C9F3D5|nr:hypothetical protein [Flavobacterium sp. CG_9.10]MBG6112211.1 hypothetical protein [Flavobacterium sp. CG_9.10]
MNNYPFRTDGIYVRNILPESIEGYKPILDDNKVWHATNYRGNISSYEIISINIYKHSKTSPLDVKGSYHTKTGELFSIIDRYYLNNYSQSRDFVVTFDEKTFKFGNDEYTIYGTPSPSTNILELVVKKTNTNLFLRREGIYQNDLFRFIPFPKTF